MRKWQVLEFDGKPYYAFVPEDDTPIKEESIPELGDDVSVVVEEQYSGDGDDDDNNNQDELVASDKIEVERLYSAADTTTEDIDDHEFVDEEPIQEVPEPKFVEVKPVATNGKMTSRARSKRIKQESEPLSELQSTGDLYQVKLESGVVLLERLNVKALKTEPLTEEEENPDDDSQDYSVGEVVAQESDQADDTTEADTSQEVEETTTAAALKCKVCTETFDSKLAFKKHVAWTHKKKICLQEGGSYVCAVCDYETSKKSLFAAHLQRKHETHSRKRAGGRANVMFPCPACGFECRSKHSLQSHFTRKHTDSYAHQCKFCPKKFKVKGDLTNHIRFHHKEKPVSCDVCNKVCLNSGSLYVHKKWAHFKPKFECQICHRRMVTQENLDQHLIMQHEKREKIVCAECGKTFGKKDSFKRHMAVHTGNKPYDCVICHKAFARRSQMRQHLLIHTGKKPFKCDLCGKGFTQKPGLICHRKTHPGEHPPLPVMPIGDIVKSFTDSYLANSQAARELKRLNETAAEDEEDEADEEEEYEEGLEEEMVEEEQIFDDDVQIE